MYTISRKENGKRWNRIVDTKPEGLFKSATEKEKFDYCIKQSLISGCPYLPGLRLDNNDSNFGLYLKRYDRFYDRYLSEKLKIEKILSDSIKKQYNNGSGNELTSGKFYSVASSSRFAVSSFSTMSNSGKIELVKTIRINDKIEPVKVLFEEGLKISGIESTPQMDVVLTTNSNDQFFIEVKCHEIFDSHKEIKLKWKYTESDFFRKLPLDLNENGKGTEYISINDEFLTAESFGCDISTTHFDFKQFICHLLGILSYQKENQNKKIFFYYLFYKNKDYLKVGNKDIYDELEKEMSVIFGKFRDLFPSIEFGYCYNDKFDTLKTLKNEYS